MECGLQYFKMFAAFRDRALQVRDGGARTKHNTTHWQWQPEVDTFRIASGNVEGVFIIARWLDHMRHFICGYAEGWKNSDHAAMVHMLSNYKHALQATDEWQQFTEPTKAYEWKHSEIQQSDAQMYVKQNQWLETCYDGHNTCVHECVAQQMFDEQRDVYWKVRKEPDFQQWRKQWMTAILAAHHVVPHAETQRAIFTEIEQCSVVARHKQTDVAGLAASILTDHAQKATPHIQQFLPSSVRSKMPKWKDGIFVWSVRLPKRQFAGNDLGFEWEKAYRNPNIP